MKKIFSFSMCLMMAMVMLVVTACGSKENKSQANASDVMFATETEEAAPANPELSGLLAQIPADADLVMVGDFKTILESAGGSYKNHRIVVPSYLMNMLPRREQNDINEVLEKMEESGLDLSAAAVSMDYKKLDLVPVVLHLAIADRDQLVRCLSENNIKKVNEEKGVAYYAVGDYMFALNGKYVVAMQSRLVYVDYEGAQAELDKVIAGAKRASYATTAKGKYIAGSNVGGVAISLKFPADIRRQLRNSGLTTEMMNNYENYDVCMRGALTPNKAILDFKLLTKDGSPIKVSDFGYNMDITSTVNPSVLNLLGRDEYMVMAFSLKDVEWDKYIEIMGKVYGSDASMRANLKAAAEYLKKIDGTVAMGLGYNGTWEELEHINNSNILDLFSMTFAVEAKPGEAKSMLDMVKMLLASGGIEFEQTENSLVLNLGTIQPGLNGAIYMKTIGNVLAIATHPITESGDNVVLRKMDFSKYLSAFCLYLDKKTEVMRDLDIDNTLSLSVFATPNMKQSAMVLAIDGDSHTGVVEKFAKMCYALYQHFWNEEPKVTVEEFEW